MKSTALILTMIFAFAAHADFQPVSKGSNAGKIAELANNIFKVLNFRINGMQYKIVEMDSVLNGDTSLTTMLLVGESVGGDAGYEAAFLLGPTETRSSLKSAENTGRSLKLVFSDLNGHESLMNVIFDAEKKVLVELK